MKLHNAGAFRSRGYALAQIFAFEVDRGENVQVFIKQ